MRSLRGSGVPMLLVVICLVVLGCSAHGTPMAPATRAVAGSPTSAAATPMPTVTAAEVASDQASGRSLYMMQPRPSRMIIKNAEMVVLVKDTDQALDLVTQIVGDVGGYMLSSRIWYESWQDASYKYATVTLGVPVNAFETTLRRLRGLAVQVSDETAAGQDVTDEYVDLESRLRNLEATRDRIREFLDAATTVDEALRVNEQLKSVEGEIEQVQGRMNYLFDRSGYSTVAVQIRPELPAAPTPTPTPIPGPWSATPIARDAAKTLTTIVQELVGVVIWLGIVVLPLALPVLAVVWLVRATRRVDRGGSASSSS